MAVGVIMFQISRYWQRSVVEGHTKKVRRVVHLWRYNAACVVGRRFMLSVMRKEDFEKAEGMNENS